MATFFTTDEKIEQLEVVLDRYDEVIERFSEAVEYEKNLIKNKVASPDFLETRLNLMLDGSKEALTTDIGGILTVLESRLELWAPIVDRSMLIRPDYWLTGIAVDVDIGGGQSTLARIQEDAANIFDVFDVSDTVEITNAEDPDHNGLHTVAIVTASLLTFNAIMLGSDNASDETMIIRLFQR